MLSRRNFLKISGVGAVALGSGFGAGKLTGNDNSDYLRVQAFLPDTDSAAELTSIFGRKLKFAGTPVVYAESNWKDVISGAYSSTNPDGKVVFRIEKMKVPFRGDLMVSDNRLNIYSPEEDFNISMTILRDRIRQRDAYYQFIAEYRNEGILSSLFRNNDKIAIIEDENGIFDKVKLNGTKKNLLIKGPSGKTGITIENNGIAITSSCCRNNICTKAGLISEEGESLACAPNKVIVRIERA